MNICYVELLVIFWGFDYLNKLLLALIINKNEPKTNYFF